MGDKTGSDRIRIVIAALLAYALLRCCAASNAYKEEEKAHRALCSEVQALREERDASLHAWDSGPDDREIEKLARERLGLIMPNATIFSFTEAANKEG